MNGWEGLDSDYILLVHRLRFFVIELMHFRRESADVGLAQDKPVVLTKEGRLISRVVYRDFESS